MINQRYKFKMTKTYNFLIDEFIVQRKKLKTKQNTASYDRRKINDSFDEKQSKSGRKMSKIVKIIKLMGKKQNR